MWVRVGKGCMCIKCRFKPIFILSLTGLLRKIKLLVVARSVSRRSSVGITTRYGMDGPGIDSRWEARFSAPVQTGLGDHPASYAMGTVP